MLNQSLRVAGMIVMTTALFSCVVDEANRYYGDVTYPPKQVQDVEVLKSAPDKSYTVLADFQAKRATAEYLRKLAAEIGADAVIITHVGGSYSHQEVWADKDRHSNTYTRIVGTAIKYD